MRLFYKAASVRLVAFHTSGRWYLTATRRTKFSEFQRRHAAKVGTLASKPWQLVFATRRKRTRFLRRIRARVDWAAVWWWYIGRR
ncbi:MAG: hypothetical protein ACSLEZ_12860 [Thiobacillus sp.]